MLVESSSRKNCEMNKELNETRGMRGWWKGWRGRGLFLRDICQVGVRSFRRAIDIVYRETKVAAFDSEVRKLTPLSPYLLRSDTCLLFVWFMEQALRIVFSCFARASGTRTKVFFAEGCVIFLFHFTTNSSYCCFLRPLQFRVEGLMINWKSAGFFEARFGSYECCRWKMGGL